MAHGAAIDHAHRRAASKSAGDESFIGTVDIIKRKGFFAHRDASFTAHADDVAARDAGDALFTRGSPNLTTAHDEEVSGVAGGNKAVRIEHQGFIITSIGRLDASRDAVEFGM